MAYPSTEVNRFRDKVTSFVENMREIDAILAVVEDQGVDDAARQAFFTLVFDGSYDINWATFAAGVVALRAIRTARDANKLAIAKLLK
jgi:hypothetical protein